MFYLLENNMIIDSTIPYIPSVLWEVNKNRLLVKYKDGKLLQVYENDKIKKQSENVYDLIEEGDLVETFSTISKVFKIINRTIITPLDVPFDISLVIKIYKPNSKGDYIKVWERKEENE